MPPRKTTDFGALFESLIDDLKIQVAASVDQNLTEINKRLSRLEKRIDQLDPAHAEPAVAPQRRTCLLCERVSVARSLCSAHYQQWRYRERKNAGVKQAAKNKDLQPTILIPLSQEDRLDNN